MSTSKDDEEQGMNGFMHEGARDRRIRHALSDEAAEWFVLMRDERLGARHRQRNVRWLKQSPDHIAELLRIQQVYKVLRAAKLQDRPPGASNQEDEPESNVIDLARRLPPPPPELPRSQPRFQSWRIAAVVACLTVSLLLAYMLKGVWLEQTIETELGQWQTAELTDGTRVRVGPGSLLQVAYDHERRTVRLIRGEAMFNVAKAARPFFVQSEMIGVLAVGTEFRVSRRGGEDVVAVTEGNVAVYRDDAEPAAGAKVATPVANAEATAAVPLAAGEQVSVTSSQAVVKQKINVDYEQAWVDGWLVYEDKTIGEVASEFNRRNRTKIVVTEPAIAERHLAFFRGIATDPESFVAAISRSPDITVVRGGPNELRIELSPQS